MSPSPSGYYALIYDAADDYVTRRESFREQHLRFVREAHARGELTLAGALGDPPDGALLVFRADSPTVAEAFARRDPYVTNGVVSGWRVRLWNLVVDPES
jgi:uncharacterized protein YciI